MRHLSVLILCGLVTACSSNTNQTNVLDNSTSTLGYLEVPAGFSVEVFAEGVEGARQMALGETESSTLEHEEPEKMGNYMP